MIRLYVDQDFLAGTSVTLPPDELRYFRSVRRGQGEVCLFNRRGQVALGRVFKTGFEIVEVQRCQVPSYPLRVVVSAPEASALSLLIRGISELGVERLTLFRGERSQVALDRMSLSRLQRMAIEACRQCGRARPLEIEIEDRSLEVLDFSETHRFIFDEAEAEAGSSGLFRPAPTVVLLGSEGGWTNSERDMARQRGFVPIHFRTPILRVETASIAASLWALDKIFSVSKPSTSDQEG